VADSSRFARWDRPVKSGPIRHRSGTNILPEEGQRGAIARASGVSAGNEFPLLEHLGGEVAGAPMLLPEGQLPPAPASGTPIFLMMSICCNYCSICRAAL